MPTMQPDPIPAALQTLGIFQLATNQLIPILAGQYRRPDGNPTHIPWT